VRVFGGDGGDEEFDHRCQPGHSIGCFYGGINGHLHHIGVYSGPTDSDAIRQKVIYYDPADSRFDQEFMHGNEQEDTVNMEYNIDIMGENHAIRSITVYSDHYVHGFQIDYCRDNVVQRSFPFLGREFASQEPQEQTLYLRKGEFLTYVGGRAGDVIDQLVLRTSKGQELIAGGNGGEEFDMEVPEGHDVGAIKGGLGGHLHNISIMVGKTPRCWRNDAGTDSDSE
jgi:hypothetical protein